jgi:hypothetical protein
VTSRARRTPSTARRIVVTLLVLAALTIVVRYGVLFVSAREGDVPPASVVALPSGARVVDDDVECGSGGCWRLVTVRPPSGVSAEALATELGTTSGVRIRGTVWDPRTVNLSSEVDEGFLVVQANYWSQPIAP